MAPVVERRKKIQFAKGNVYEGKPFSGLRYVEDKLDGLRGGILIKDGKGSAFTLTGLPIPNAQHIVDEIVESGQFDNMFLDSEFKGRDWNESQSIVKTQSPHPDAASLSAYTFDCMTAEQWESKGTTGILSCRKVGLATRLRYSLLPHVIYVKHVVISGNEQVIPARNEAVSRGLEGIMIKDPNARYAFKKNNDWLKCKPINEGDFRITGATVGRGKNSGMLGALAIKGVKHNGGIIEIAADIPTLYPEGEIIISEVGTGFDDLTRKQLWADYLNGKLIGRVVQVEYQEATEDNSLRFPSFMRMRDDKQ